MDEKIFFKVKIGYILLDLNWIFLIKPSEFKIYILVKIYYENIAEKY